MVNAGLVELTAVISPFRQDRDEVRAMFLEHKFIKMFVDAPLVTCEQRDPKGLYRKARKGLIRDFTGIDSPYEAPLHPEIYLNTESTVASTCAGQVTSYLQPHSFALSNGV